MRSNSTVIFLICTSNISSLLKATITIIFIIIIFIIIIFIIIIFIIIIFIIIIFIIIIFIIIIFVIIIFIIIIFIIIIFTIIIFIIRLNSTFEGRCEIISFTVVNIKFHVRRFFRNQNFKL